MPNIKTTILTYVSSFKPFISLHCSSPFIISLVWVGWEVQESVNHTKECQ